MRITWEAVEKPANLSLFEASRLNSPKLGVKFFDRLMDYTQSFTVKILQGCQNGIIFTLMIVPSIKIRRED